MRRRRRIALALSGGAAYGVVHLGALQVLEEENIRVRGIAGASAGALVGVLYAFDVSVAEMRTMAADLSWPDLTRPTRPHLGLLSLQKMQEWIEKRIGTVGLEEAPIRLAVVTTDLAGGEAVIFERGSAAFAVTASCAVPGLFRPLEYKERLLSDGGLVNNLPVTLARRMSVGKVVACDALSAGEHPMPANLFDVVLRSVNLMVSHGAAAEREKADVLITPDTRSYSSADLGHAEELFEAGYRAARQALKKARWIR